LSVADVADPSFSLSYGDLMRVSESGEIIASSFLKTINRHPLTDLRVMLRHNMYILPSATLIRRSAFLAVGGFDESLRGFEDDDFFLRLHLRGYGSKFTSKEVTAWTVNTSSTSFSESMCRSRFLYFSKLYKYFSTKENLQLQGIDNVFRDFLFPRFSVNFANDVVASSLGSGSYHLERVNRLKIFRNVVRRDKSMKKAKQWSFQIATFPLVTLGRGFQRVLLKALIGILGFTGSFGIHSLEEFMRLHSSTKEFIDKSLWVSN
jgi:GT2 family glycosyltransferase